MGLGKTAAFCILGSVRRTGVQCGRTSIPAVSLGLVAGLTWKDGWRSPDQAASQCRAHKAQIFPPVPRAARGKAKSLRSVPLSRWWR